MLAQLLKSQDIMQKPELGQWKLKIGHGHLYALYKWPPYKNPLWSMYLPETNPTTPLDGPKTGIVCIHAIYW
jgi:hypothetical protein